ncbi:MAG: hypothetical protein U0136_18795 [Bdellovibrionota bacterium]
MKVHASHFAAFTLSAFLGAHFLGCSKSPNQAPEIRTEMRDAYQQARELFGYVWSPTMFQEKRNEKRIAALLAALGEDFHRVEIDAPLDKFEPGFRVTLLAQRRLLADAGERFNEGKKDYANWKLRGMTANCISCHSRYQVPVNFIGDYPNPDESSSESRLAQAEFLFATRQFDVASTRLEELARSFASIESGWRDAYRALKLWLVIQVRTKNESEKAALFLERFVADGHVPSDYAPVLRRWIDDLRHPIPAPSGPEQFVSAAKLLLDGFAKDSTVDDDDGRLVSTLRATSLLHQQLESSPTPELRKRATYLLGLAYSHLSIPLFEPFAEQYLQVCIRDFPHTVEARKAYELYSERLTGDLGVSGEQQLSKSQQKELTELKKLASPESSATINDTTAPL